MRPLRKLCGLYGLCEGPKGVFRQSSGLREVRAPESRPGAGGPKHLEKAPLDDEVRGGVQNEGQVAEDAEEVELRVLHENGGGHFLLRGVMCRKQCVLEVMCREGCAEKFFLRTAGLAADLLQGECAGRNVPEGMFCGRQICCKAWATGNVPLGMHSARAP